MSSIPYSQGVQRVRRLARELADAQSHGIILSEQVLRAILSDGDGVGRHMLAHRSVDPAAVQAIERQEMEIPVTVTLGDIVYEKDVVVLDQVARELAETANAKEVGCDHFLMAMVMSPHTEAGRILNELHVSPADLYAVMRRAGAPEETVVTPPGPTKTQQALATQARRIPVESTQRGGSMVQVSTVSEVKIPCTTDLTHLASKGEILPIIARDAEVERVMNTLTRRTKNNPALIGEPGVGKTAIAEGLALLIAEGKVPDSLKDCHVLKVDLGAMLANPMQFSALFKQVLDAAEKSDGKYILFFDELHTLVGPGRITGIDAANMIKPLLDRGKVRVIGATTLKEYREHIEGDSALERRFQPVTIEPTSVEDTVAIVTQSQRPALEKHYRDRNHTPVILNRGAIQAAAELAERYISDRYQPDKTIDVLDETAARLANRSRRARKHPIRMTAMDVADTVERMTGVPVHNLAGSELERLQHIEDALRARIVGQDDAVEAVADAVRVARMGLNPPKKPSGRLLFVGPSGTGKTELCKALAEYLFGTEDALVVIDGGEYTEEHSGTRLTGAPPSYVGYKEGGQLTEAVHRRPFSIVLFDELDKMHPTPRQRVLNLLEEGRMTDGQGRQIDFSNTIVVATGNFGSQDLDRNNEVGFARSTDPNKRNERHVIETLERETPPEFRRRIDETIVFKQLTDTQLEEIARRQIEKIIVQPSKKGRNVNVVVDPAVYTAIAKDPGRKASQGAGHIYGAIKKRVTAPVALKMAGVLVKQKNGRAPAGGVNLYVDVDANGAIVVDETPLLKLATPGRPAFDGVSAA